MAEPPFDLSKAHRWFAVEFNNRSWDIIESQDRSAEQVEELIHTAHASVRHWIEAGKPINRLRGYCLLAHAYCTADDGATALNWARRCVDLLEPLAADVTGFDRASALGCLARSQRRAGQADAAKETTARTMAAIAELADAEERSVAEKLCLAE